MKTHHCLTLTAASMFVLAFGCSGTDGAGVSTAKLIPECTEDATELEGWLCPEDLVVECEHGVADPALIYFEPSGDLPESCDEIVLTLNDEGPFGLGTHDIVITGRAGDGNGEPVEATCEAKLTVEDTRPPDPNDETIELWPPNHKFHTIVGDDCVQDACDGDLRVTFLSASSDEPVNDKGDGNTEPDIILECDRVQVRAERQGGSNGRIYTLGWRAVDHSGNQTEGECIVAVPHDQSGTEAVDDGPAYEMTLDAEECDDGAGGTGGDGGAGGSGGEDGTGGAGGAGGTGGSGGDDGTGGAGGDDGMGGSGGDDGTGGSGGDDGTGGIYVL